LNQWKMNLSMSEHCVYGLHAVSALLANPHRTTYKLFVSENRSDAKLQAIVDTASKTAIPITALSSQAMNQRFPDYNHQGVVASASALPDYGESHLQALLQSSKTPGLILILDGVTDPHNLGACLRVADAAGVDFVVIPKDKSASITPVVSKVACGAAESVPLVRVTNLVRAMETLKAQGVWIYGAAGEAEGLLYNIECTGTIALAMGAEGEGLRRLTRDHCDGLFSLPMLGVVDSLNVSVATGVALYEVVRQRSSNG
jgi:23S rRNA (guanosine2251-2'-O)-methyltransferase